jgi:hypothetical protein
MLESDYEFEAHCRAYTARGHGVAVILEAARTAYGYHSDSVLMTRNETKWKRAISALGIAWIIASLELGWREDDGSPLDITKLGKRYGIAASKWRMKTPKSGFAP